MAPAELAGVLQKTRQPFNVNALAQAAALAGLADTEHQAKTKAMTDAGRAQMQSAFASLGLEFVPSHANFVLVKVGDGDLMFRELLHRGIIVRAMRAYQLPEWIRVTIGTPEQNRRFLETLRELLAATASRS
jgi:histidinol-phosphate aminotransferase